MDSMKGTPATSNGIIINSSLHVKSMLQMESRQDSGNCGNQNITFNMIKDKVDTSNPHFNACYICSKTGHYAK